MLATIVGILITTFLIVIIFIGIISAVVSSSEDGEVEIKENTILYVDLSQEVSDRGNNNPMDNFDFVNFRSSSKLGLKDILENIKKAKTDDNIKGIYLNPLDMKAGMASVEEIRNALIDFKKSEKFIISYADIYTQKSYYLATTADSIFLNPEGTLEFRGLSAELTFFKNLLEKIGVEPQVLRHGKFKSAIEPFIADKMSEANREQTSVYLNSIWNQIIKGISEKRNIPEADLNKYADSLSMFNPQKALENKLVDGLRYKDEIINGLKKLTGINETEDLRVVTLKKYTNVPVKKEKKGVPKDKIAVIYASGEIVMGNGSKDQMGCDKISKAIREARRKDNIKAIVLRVNSPGGSALASEIIWREVVLAKQVKPVIVSMGDVAASGGYYISCGADTIIANPNTITGSIGVFGIMFNANKLLTEKLGITSDRVTTNAHSDIGSISRSLKPHEQKVIQNEIEGVYETFISHVADGRKITKNQVDSIGQGRVWTGANAKEIGLVDLFGGLDRAIEIAAEKAKITDYRLINLPAEKEPIEQLIDELMGDGENVLMKKQMGDSYKYYEYLNNFINMDKIQARLPYLIEIY
jgi:protease-4